MMIPEAVGLGPEAKTVQKLTEGAMKLLGKGAEKEVVHSVEGATEHEIEKGAANAAEKNSLTGKKPDEARQVAANDNAPPHANDNAAQIGSIEQKKVANGNNYIHSGDGIGAGNRVDATSGNVIYNAKDSGYGTGSVRSGEVGTERGTYNTDSASHKPRTETESETGKIPEEKANHPTDEKPSDGDDVTHQEGTEGDRETQVNKSEEDSAKNKQNNKETKGDGGSSKEEPHQDESRISEKDPAPWENVAPVKPEKGNMTVYISIDEKTGKVQYVGITNNIDRRAGEHEKEKGIQIEAIKGLRGISYDDAKNVEQTLIDYYGLGKNGGQLMNKINSVSPKNLVRRQKVDARGFGLLKYVKFGIKR